MFYNINERVGKPSGIKCPITGSDLIYDGYESDKMDGDSYYHSESDPELKWEKNARSPYFELVHKESRWGASSGEAEARRYFKLDDKNEWVEYFAVHSVDRIRMFEVGTSLIDVDNILQLDIAAKKLREEEYARKVASGEINLWMFPTVRNIKPTTIAKKNGDDKTTVWNKDKVIVSQMPPPQGTLFYLDFKYGSSESDKPEYPYEITPENIETVRKNWKDLDLQVGDQITQWDKSGWGSLSGRAGEQVRRNGEIIHTRLTRMS
jgi:hypothetical protein